MRTIILLIITITISFSVFAQQNISSILTIGDKAPELKYSRWLQGTPEIRMSDEKIYVLEFWATWCGPCVAAMPHLSKLSKLYQDKITFIGINVWEDIPESEAYENIVPVLKKFIENQGERLTYNVVVETNDRYMAKNWLEKSMSAGIPISFVIKKGIIQWIGHPAKLDSILIAVMDQSFDYSKYRQERQINLLKRLQEKEENKKLFDQIEEKVNNGEYLKAIKLMDSTGASKPVLKYSMNMKKFRTLLIHISENEAIKYAEENNQTGYCAPFVIEEKGLSKETYLWAINIFKMGRIDPGTLDKIATGYAMMGDFKTALSFQTQSIKDGKVAINSGSGGKLSASAIKEFERKLKIYETKVSKE